MFQAAIYSSESSQRSSPPVLAALHIERHLFVPCSLLEGCDGCWDVFAVDNHLREALSGSTSDVKVGLIHHPAYKHG